MEQKKYMEDIREIKDMMNRSSRFISLSGLSGITSGVIALGGAYIAYGIVYGGNNIIDEPTILSATDTLNILLVALATLALAIGANVYFTSRETRKRNEKLIDHQSVNMLRALATPLLAGGLVCLLLLLGGSFKYVAPLTLVFYGLALVSASRYTLPEIRTLGILEIILGLVSLYFTGYGLLFWSIGFGVLHIIIGIVMHFRYNTK